jgi:hypothetical protein
MLIFLLIILCVCVCSSDRDDGILGPMVVFGCLALFFALLL